MATTELVIGAAELQEISFRCKCGGAAIGVNAEADIVAWHGSCPSCAERMDVVSIWKKFRDFQAAVQAKGAPSVEFRIALEQR